MPHFGIPVSSLADSPFVAGQDALLGIGSGAFTELSPCPQEVSMGSDEFDDEPMGFEEEPEEEWTPKPEPGKPGPYSLPPAKEKLAGFWDGQRRGRALLLNAARSSLAKFHIVVEDDGTLLKVDDVPTFELLPVMDPDNPLDDLDYIEG
jgi:hypothetical protein